MAYVTIESSCPVNVSARHHVYRHELHRPATKNWKISDSISTSLSIQASGEISLSEAAFLKALKIVHDILELHLFRTKTGIQLTVKERPRNFALFRTAGVQEDFLILD
jgi:hypothetical protein